MKCEQWICNGIFIIVEGCTKMCACLLCNCALCTLNKVCRATTEEEQWKRKKKSITGKVEIMIGDNQLVCLVIQKPFDKDALRASKAGKWQPIVVHVEEMVYRWVFRWIFFIGATEALITSDMLIRCFVNVMHECCCFTHIFLSSSWYINYWSIYFIAIQFAFFVSFESNIFLCVYVCRLNIGFVDIFIVIFVCSWNNIVEL